MTPPTRDDKISTSKGSIKDGSNTDDELQSLLDFACELADAAAQITRHYFRQPLSVDNKLSANEFDPVTIADRAAEESMRKLITVRYPDHGIYGEEYGTQTGKSSLTWVLDPIDGTRAFISGMPTWGTLIALYDGTRPVIGIMDQPFTGERYLASVALLAAGHIDLVVESDLSAYDIQALIPIVENAGGIVSDWSGGPAVNGGQIIAAASQVLHQKALDLLQSAAKKSDSIL